MESTSKRRKIDHAGTGLRHRGLIDFEFRGAAQVSVATAFVLQTEQLLDQVRIDYPKALKGADGHLYRLKAILDAIEPHEPRPVCSASPQPPR